MITSKTFAVSRRSVLRTGLAAAAASGALMGGLRGALADDTLAEVKKRGELVIATEMQFPPFDISDNGVYKGVDRDLIDAVGKEMGVKVKYLDLPWTSVLPGLEAKKFDLCIAPVTITKERMKRYLFTVPIADATAALMKRADDKSIMKPEDIAGKTVGGQKGTSQLAQLKEFAAKLPKPVEVKEYVDNNQSYADLAAGRIDASVNSLAESRLCGVAALRHVRDGPAALRPADLFLLGRRGSTTRRWSTRSTPRSSRPRMTERWRRSRRPGSARRWICPRRFPNRRSDGSRKRRDAAALASPARCPMNPEIILHSFGYLMQAAGVTIAVSLRRHRARLRPRRAASAWRGSRAMPALARVGAVYVSFFRGVPLLVQLLFIYYFLAEFGLDVPALVAAVGGLGLSSGAYQAEILRGALNAVPRGQAEARWRSAIAAPISGGASCCRRRCASRCRRFINEFILLLKASSLVSVVGIAELTRASMNIASSTYRPFEAYVGGGLFYLAINLSLRGLRHFRRAAARPWDGRDELRRPLVLSPVAAQRLCRHHPVLGRGRRSRPGARLRHRAARPAAIAAAALAAAGLSSRSSAARPSSCSLFLLYAGGPSIGLELNATTAGIARPRPLFLRLFRRDLSRRIQCRAAGQVEAAMSVGMKPLRHARARIKLPLMLVATVPAIVNMLIILSKETVVLSIITVPELMYEMQTMAAETFTAFDAIFAMAIFYWLLVEVVSRLGAGVERRVTAFMRSDGERGMSAADDRDPRRDQGLSARSRCCGASTSPSMPSEVVCLIGPERLGQEHAAALRQLSSRATMPARSASRAG